MREERPLFCLRIRPLYSGPEKGDESDSSLDTLSVMISQDVEYRCQDYLARRNSSNKYQRINVAADDKVDVLCREKMCEWGYRVVDHFRANREAVAIMFSLVDRFVDKCSCNRNTFKLAAMCALYMSMKVCSTQQISIYNLAELSRGEFAVEDIAEMERTILRVLKWRINPPTTQAFVERLCRLVPLDDAAMMKIIFDRAIFFAELSVYDYAFVPEDRYAVSVACLLNAMETLSEDFICNHLQAEFIVVLNSSLCVQIDPRALEYAQDRLWFLYSSSEQLQHDDILPLHLLRDQSGMSHGQKRWESGVSLSPTGVNSVHHF